VTVTAADMFAVSAESEDPLRDDLIGLVQSRHDATPRHLQVELGPSEVGHPCMRKLAFGLMGVEQCNPDWDPLPSIIGTATHSWLQSAAQFANEVAGRERWLAERRVTVTTGLSGTADLFDRDTSTVIDWKVPGQSRFQMYRKNMSVVFQGQAHLYGLGFENAGFEVQRVAVALLPRGGTLRGMHVWQEPYDREFARGVLQRRDAVIALVNDFGVQDYPDRYQWIPVSPYDCRFCSWFKPDPKSPIQCRGDAK
jgi:hypothetical protein